MRLLEERKRRNVIAWRAWPAHGCGAESPVPTLGSGSGAAPADASGALLRFLRAPRSELAFVFAELECRNLALVQSSPEPQCA
jgi:hypothetical protein